jgi:hypothetical protein
MKTKIVSAVLLGLGAGLLCFSPEAKAAEKCSYITLDLQDSFYSAAWGCQQVFINDMWSRFHMSTSYWSGGWWGYEAPCDNGRPLKRTFNGLMVLGYSVTSSPTCSTSDPNMGKWAYCWAGNNIDELTTSCATDARATTQFGSPIDNYTTLKIPFLRDETVVQRASTVFHEARHANGWCRHNSSPCGAGLECEPSFSGSGCVGFGSSSGFGAFGYQALWLNWFASTAQSGWINFSTRADAVAEGNRILANNFSTKTCSRLDSNGFMFQIC